MRAIIAAVAVFVMSLMASEPGFSQTNSYNRCAQLASQQGLRAKSASGRRFINRCMQRQNQQRPSRSCPDDPRARSAYPAWMCP